MASQVALLGKNPPAMQETSVIFLVTKFPWRRDRLPIPVFLGFSGGSDGKESACNAGDLGLLLTPVFWPGEFHGLYSPWGHKQSDVTE